MKVQNAPLIILPGLVLLWIGALLLYFPCGSIAVPLLSMTAAAAITLAAYRATGFCSRTGLYILMAAWLLLATGYVLNLNWFTVHDGGTLTAPVFKNFDASLSWLRMKEVLGGVDSGEVRMLGYGQLMALLCFGMQPRLDVLLAYNVLATLLTVVLTGVTAAYLVPGDSHAKKRISSVSMALMSGVCYFMASGCIFIKDAMMSLAFAAVLFALAKLQSHERSYYVYIIFVVAILLAAMVRPLLLPFVVLSTIMMTWISPRKRIIPAVVIIVLCTALFIYTRHLGTAAEVINIHGTTSMELETGASQRLEAYHTISPSYNSLPLVSKLVRLPFSLCVQFLTPLPWSFGRDVVFGPTQAYAHVAYPWYAIGGVAIYFLFFMIRKAPRGLSILFTIGVIATVITAFFTGGTISRYCLPWLATLIPGAAAVIATGEWKSKRFAIWAAAFAGLVATALCVAFYFLDLYSPGGWDAV